ncbi:protein-L-isoaspartate O-methyltransferase [Roseovarius sp. A-2]|uniref:FkbM family methyltransferase n=1 Tax=Roseovarius sp. A-2 TaxID=1570360 RepID=UPI0009B54CE6|nr:FkbM family methyltransferase [Roseovarius sp. A-2]GAW33963.1 protein-L-isoaspartate O-methyltransferase [Roseovarius sp. A-2]
MAEYEIDGLTLDVPEKLLNDRIAAKLASGKYEGQEAAAARMRLREGQRVLELGAGIGYIATLCARVAGAENVTTIEANPAMLPVIRANLDRNGAEAATLLHGAVTGRAGTEAAIAFDGARSFWAGHIADEDSAPDRLVKVPVLGLDALLERARPHLVIMDIEGAEAYLFDAPWPDHVTSVMMELHPGRYPDTVIQRIVDCMSGSGLTYDPGPSRGRILCFRRVRGR